LELKLNFSEILDKDIDGGEEVLLIGQYTDDETKRLSDSKIVIDIRKSIKYHAVEGNKKIEPINID